MPVRRAIRWIVVLVLLGGLIAIGIVRGRPSWHARQASRLQVVDDFTDGANPNLIGGEQVVMVGGDSTATTTYIRMATPTGDRMALALDYRIAPRQTMTWQMGLNGLDISAAEELLLWLRAGEPAAPLRVELSDGQGHRYDLDAPMVLPSHRWRLVRLPTSSFSDINFNQLDSLRLILHSTDEVSQGTLAIDQVAFRGPPQVFFHSLRDNLIGFPQQPRVSAKPLLRLPPTALLRAIAEDTWGYFRDLVDTRHHLPLNYIQLAPTRQIGDYTSPTDIAMYLLAVVSARDLDFINAHEARTRIQNTLARLQRLPKWEGFLYNYYSTTNLQISRQYISSVDNGWLAAALIVVRQAFPEIAAPCNALLAAMNFSTFYDAQRGQMRLGYDTATGEFSPYHYGLLATEARLLSLIAIGKGDVAKDHWFRIYRTLPQEWTWQRQQPHGRYRTYDGHDVFQGYYLYGGVPIVPSWGGSLFEFLMPTLVVNERELAPRGLGLNNQRATDIHRRYALSERRYPVWGLSPSATPENRHGGYSEFGVAGLGSKGYNDEAVATPHVSFLALDVSPEEAVQNVRTFLRRYAIYGEYGLYDAVDVERGVVAMRYLALDQGMTLAALNNYLNQRVMQKRFHADPIGKAIEPLLQVEVFFDETGLASETKRSFAD